MIFENLCKFFNILQKLVKSLDFCKRPKLLLNDNTPQRFPLNWETLIPCTGNNIGEEASTLSFYCNVAFIERTWYCFYRFWGFSGKFNFGQNYARKFLYSIYWHVTLLKLCILVIVWTRSTECFCLQILLWERKSDLLLSTATAISYFVPYRPCAFLFPHPTNTEILII